MVWIRGWSDEVGLMSTDPADLLLATNLIPLECDNVNDQECFNALTLQ